PRPDLLVELAPHRGEVRFLILIAPRHELDAARQGVQTALASLFRKWFGDLLGDSITSHAEQLRRTGNQITERWIGRRVSSEEEKMLHEAWLDRAVAVLAEAEQTFFEQILLAQCPERGVGLSDDRNAGQVEQVGLIRLGIDENTTAEGFVRESPANRCA